MRYRKLECSEWQHCVAQPLVSYHDDYGKGLTQTIAMLAIHLLCTWVAGLVGLKLLGAHGERMRNNQERRTKLQFEGLCLAV